jgi:arsenical pump membrane protein
MRPWGWVESVVAVPAAGIAILSGTISLDQAWAEVERMGPVVGFLAAVLVLARLCDDEGLFRASGTWMAALAGPHPKRLLTAVFIIASLITAVLSLDATVVLLTPVVFATTARLGVRAKPHVYACTHLSNSGSLLLPVSNLTNLLAFTTTGLTFTRFTALMALPWITAVGAEYTVFRRFFSSDLSAADEVGPAPGCTEMPCFALAVVVLTLAGFVVASAVGTSPAWAAFAGVILLAIPSLLRHRASVRGIVRSAAPSFLLFVLALAVVVRAVVDNGLGRVLGHMVPHGDSLPVLLAIAALAAVLANLINNLPAVLVLLPFTALSGPGAVLALLLGVNIGPNLTYTGSLATMLWRRTMKDHDTQVDLKEFTILGLLAVPVTLVLAVVALWISLRIVGV